MDDEDRTQSERDRVYKKVGRLGEVMVMRFLEREGYVFIGKNIRIKRVGEIDLVFKDRSGRWLFIEVKSSYSPINSGQYGIQTWPITERVPAKKLLKLNLCASSYMSTNSISADFEIYIADVRIKSETKYGVSLFRVCQ